MGCQGSTNQAKKTTKNKTKGKATKQGQVMKNGKQQVNQMVMNKPKQTNLFVCPTSNFFMTLKILQRQT